MRLLHVGLALVLALTLAASVEARAKGDKAQKGARPVKGTVVSVKKDDGKDTGTITVRLKQGKKKQQPDQPAVEKTFKVTSATKFERVEGKKGQQQTTAGTFASVQAGDRLTITATGETAEKVSVRVKGKKKAQ